MILGKSRKSIKRVGKTKTLFIMNKALYFFSFIVFFTAISASSFAQSQKDITNILQICLDMPELQKHYPQSANKGLKRIDIMQHGVSFKDYVKSDIKSYEINLLEKAEVKSKKLESYFLFWTFKIEENKAKIEFTYNTKPNSQKVELHLTKKGENWVIEKQSIKEVRNEN